AAAACLGAGGGGPDDGEDPAETGRAPAARSGDDGAQETRPEAEEGTAPQDEEAASAAGERPRIMLRIDLGVDETGGEGAPTLAGDVLAALIAEPLGCEAECVEDQAQGPHAGCGRYMRSATHAPLAH